MEISVSKLEPDAYLPTKKRPHDAGWHLKAYRKGRIEPGERAVLNLQLLIKIPQGIGCGKKVGTKNLLGFFGQIAPMPTWSKV